jgi:alpha-L-fucosidase 2
MMLHVSLMFLTSCALRAGAKQLWAKEPAAQDNIIMTAYPVGNGKLGGKGFQFVSFRIPH